MKRIALLLLLAGCTPIADVQYAAIYYNPAFLEPLWREVSACSGIESQLGTVTFFKVERITVKDAEYRGYWTKEGNRIYLAEDYKEDPTVVKHEMLHAKLQSGEHPREYFNGRCGDLME